MKRKTIAAAAAVLSLSLAACGSTTTKTTTPAAPATTSGKTAATSAATTATTGSSTATTAKSGSSAAAAVIVIKTFAYSGTMSVKPGEKVTVKNQDPVAHTATSKAKTFDTGNIAANGGTGTFTAPTKPGSYPFGCTYHPKMHGLLIVKG